MKLTPSILAMYLGCDIKVPTGQIGNLTLVDTIAGMIGVTISVTHHFYFKDKFSPILRRLEDMTEEEARELFKLEGWGENLENIIVMDYAVECRIPTAGTAIQRFSRLRAQTLLFLLSKHFDVFGLIDSNEAIDSKTVKL